MVALRHMACEVLCVCDDEGGKGAKLAPRKKGTDVTEDECDALLLTLLTCSGDPRVTYTHTHTRDTHT